MCNSSFAIHNSRKGFTLIELLIVVAIIGILAALLMTNFVAIRQRARDAQRKSDLRQMQSSLELYRSDNGAYPITGAGVYTITQTNCPTPGSFSANNVTYMQKIPCDPNGTSYYNSGNYYYSSTDGSTYTLAACIENANDTDTNVSASAPIGLSGCPAGNKYFILLNP